MAVYYETLRHNIIHDGENLQPHCNLDPDKHVPIRDINLICQMLSIKKSTGKPSWTVCRWCIGPAIDEHEAIGLILGLIKREELQDA